MNDDFRAMLFLKSLKRLEMDLPSEGKAAVVPKQRPIDKLLPESHFHCMCVWCSQILINFVQVTSAAALINFKWTREMIRVLDVQGMSPPVCPLVQPSHIESLDSTAPTWQFSALNIELTNSPMWRGIVTRACGGHIICSIICKKEDMGRRK